MYLLRKGKREKRYVYICWYIKIQIDGVIVGESFTLPDMPKSQAITFGFAKVNMSEEKPGEVCCYNYSL